MTDGFPAPAAALLRYWADARMTGGLPPKSALDPLRFKRWIGDLSIVERRVGRKEFHVVLHGSRSIAHIGVSFHRKYLEDCVAPHAIRHCVEPYRVSIETQKPVLAVMKPGTLTGVFRKFERLILPFAGYSGSEAGRFLVWVGETGRDAMRCNTIYGEQPAALNPFRKAGSDDRILVLDVSAGGEAIVTDRIAVEPYRGHPSYSLFAGFRPRSLPV